MKLVRPESPLAARLRSHAALATVLIALATVATAAPAARAARAGAGPAEGSAASPAVPAPPTGPASGESRRGIRLDLRFSSAYNSNFLQYSPADRTAFLHRSPASRFALRSLDDAAFRTQATLTLERPLLGRRASRLAYTVTRQSMAENPVADYTSHLVTFRQPVARTAWVSAGYARMPHFYLRHLWDADMGGPYRLFPHYEAAVMDVRRVQVQAGFRPSPAWSLSGEVDHVGQTFGPEFRERDARAWTVATAFERGRANGASLSLEPAFSRRRADGHDPAHPAIPDSLRDDTSSREFGVTLGVHVPPGRILGLPADVRAKLEYSRKTFTSDRPADLGHHGRHDKDLTFNLDAERSLGGSVSIFGFVKLESQSTSLPAANTRGEAGAFRQTVAGGGIHLGYSRGKP